jgi:hypothetical protein
MTTLEPRWEKPDYTGVVAEVPLGHAPHLKKPAQKSRFELRLAKTNDLVWFPLEQCAPLPGNFQLSPNRFYRRAITF